MEDRSCPTCQRPYGVRKRCYWCNGPKKKTGETRPCAQCGKDFYAARWQLADTVRRQGTYCSTKCRLDSFRLNGPGSTYPRTDGYIALYYPTHPDASKSGVILEHRWVAEQKYGRRVLPTEHVNHINGIRDDNRPENLEIVTASAHAYISHGQKREKKAKRQLEWDAMKAALAEYQRLYGPLPGKET